MQRRILLSFASFFVALTLFGGCAARSSVAGGDAVSTQIHVDNNLPGITGVTVYLASTSGGRRSFGPLESNQRAAFDRELRAGDYQLIASRVGEPDIVSERFRVDTDGVVIIWSLAQNQLTFAER